MMRRIVPMVFENKSVKTAVVCLFMAAAFSASAATDRVWTGAGDGITWGDSANWEGGSVPTTTSDKAVIVSGESELVISNDVARNISAIDISGESSVRVVGEQLTFSARNPAFKSTVQITVDAPIAFNYTAANSDAIIVSLVDSVFNGEISLLSPNRRVRFSGTGTARFYGSVGGESASIGVMMSNGIYFYAPINIKTIETFSTEYRKLYLASSGNKVSDGFNLHFTEVRFTVENALDESTPINFMQNTYKDNAATTVYYFQNGCDQVANYIQSDKPWYNGWKDNDFLNGASAMTLTLKATQSAYTYSCLRGALSLVYDPKGDFVQTFLDRKHLTTGSLTVKGGTLRMDGTNTFASVPSVTVGAGANFEVATTNSAALASVTELTLGDGSRFSVVPTATSLFGSSATLARACDSSRFVLPAGTVLRVGSLVVDGVPISPGDYTETGDGDRQTLAQVEGEGTLTVESLPSGTWWTGAIDDDYGNADNWSAGVPSGSLVAYIEKLGGAATVQSPDEIVHDLSSFPSDDTTLAYEISHGGTLHVAGGSLSITNIRGKVRIGGDSSVTSRVEVSGGVLNLHASRQNSFAIASGGLLRLTGGETHFRYYHGSNSNPEWVFRMLGGTLEMQDSAYMSILVTGNPARLFGTGNVRVGGNARLVLANEGRPFWTPAEAGGSLDIDIYGNAIVTNTGGYGFLNGYDDGTRTTVNVRGNASLRLPNFTYIGFVEKSGKKGGIDTHGELRISENARVVAGTYGIFLGSYGSHVKASNGKVSMSSGVFDLSGVTAAAATLPAVRGLAIGYDPYAGGFTNIDNVGVFELSGGAVSNTGSSAFFVIGEGNAKGDLVQTGGTFTQGSKASYIGWYGGIGRYAFSGDGAANFSNSAVYLGSNSGKGTLEIGAGSGTFTAKSLAVAGSESAVKFVLGEDGTVARLAVNNALTVDANAKLVVDATNGANAKSVTLMTYGSRSGEFAAENIEILAAKPQSWRVVQSATGVRLYHRYGMEIIFR